MDELKEYVRIREAEIEKISIIRYDDEANIKRDSLRDDADVDYARVLYSSSFRRLQGKMQLLVPGQIHFYRNRLTHSLEVSQIARSIAKRIGLTDTLTVQTCSLAHDIGNPPFGHAGEIFLSQFNQEVPYEGNAQTFRILTNIEDKFHDCSGLNLTLRTLLGVVKYPNNPTQNPDKFLYENDYKTITEWTATHNLKLKTIDCEIMDLADEIAYAAHDLEDTLRMKYFTIDDLLFEFSISEFKDCLPTLQELVNNAKDYALKAKTYETSEEFSILFYKELTSSIVNLLVVDIGLITSDKEKKLGYLKYSCIAKGLKKLTFKAVKRRPDIIRYEQLGKKILSGLYEVLTDEKFNKDLVLLPAEYRDKSEKVRTILDYIGGMMDSYAIDQYKVYFGNNSLDCLYNEKKPYI
jgi:dGTPase